MVSLVRLAAIVMGLLPALIHAAPGKLTVGALAYGTLNWELTVIEREGLGLREGFELVVRTLANPQAGRIALQGGSADVIVTNWLWVARQRAEGHDFTTVPYSLTHGALIVPADSSIRSIRDLAGKRIGVAGSPLYENWLLLKTFARQRFDLDLNREAEPVFGAPPLLNQQLLQGRVDALLNYWHYAARLEARGYRRLLDGTELLQELGIKPAVPTLGYVFNQSWAKTREETIKAFIRAAYQAKDMICSDERVWQYVAPMSGSKDPNVRTTLRQRYCEGRIRHWGEEPLHAAGKLYTLLHQVGGKALTGDTAKLPEGTFWSRFVPPN